MKYKTIKGETWYKTPGKPWKKSPFEFVEDLIDWLKGEGEI